MSGGGDKFVPRILLKGIPEMLKFTYVYNELHKFGTIIYIGMGKDVAIVEFLDRISMGKVLARCPLRWRGKSVSASHEPDWKKIAHLVNKSESFVLVEDLKTILNNQEEFYAKLDHLVAVANEMTLPFDDDPEHHIEPTSRHPVCSVLERVLSEDLSHDLRVYPFGSRVTGTALETSDLDLYVDCDNGYYLGTFRDAHDHAKLVEIVKKQLGRSYGEFNHVYAVPRARVPIVKFLHCQSNTRCDVSFNNGLGCRNARLVHFIISLDDRIRPLILLMKYWVYHINLKATLNKSRPELTSHALGMLIFTYLQTTKPPILPPINKMKESAGYSIKIEGIESAFSNDLERFKITDPSDNRTVHDLFLGFVRQFQSVDWSRLAASPLEGAHVPRNSLSSKIPVNNLPLVVLDPLDLSRNLTTNLSDVTLCRLLAVSALTEKEMTAD